MAKDTLRDRVWKTALQFSAGQVEHDTPPEPFESHTPDGFRKRKLQEAVDASDRVVHDVLQTMADYGFLQQKSQRVYVDQGDNYAIHEATVYSAAGEATPVGEAGQSIDEPAVADTDSQADIEQETSGQGSEDFACNICGDTFETERPKNLHVTQSEDHVRVSDRDECPECGESFEYVKADTADGRKWDVTVVHEVSRTETPMGAFPTIEDRCLISDAEA